MVLWFCTPKLIIDVYQAILMIHGWANNENALSQLFRDHTHTKTYSGENH